MLRDGYPPSLESLECAATSHVHIGAHWKRTGQVDPDPQDRHYFCDRCGVVDRELMGWMRSQARRAA